MKNPVSFETPQHVVYNDNRKVIERQEPDEGSDNRNRNQKKIWYWIGHGVALLLMFGAGYMIGLKNGEIHVDGKDISVSKSGIIHNSDCIYFKENCAQNCQFCGGLKTK